MYIHILYMYILRFLFFVVGEFAAGVRLAHTYIHSCMHTYIRTYTCTHTHMYTYMHVYSYIFHL